MVPSVLQRFLWTMMILFLLSTVTHAFPQPQLLHGGLLTLPQPKSTGWSRRSSSSTALSDKPNIEVISQPDEEFLQKEGVFRWGTWGCLPGKFPWSYGESESCYLLSGQVTVTPTDGRPAATFGKGDFVTFPAGLSCEWDVTEAVQKHFKFF